MHWFNGPIKVLQSDTELFGDFWNSSTSGSR